MQAQDVMTKDLITVAPDTSVSEIAGLLVQHRISAVPVVTGEGQLVGIISQTDLGHRSETFENAVFQRHLVAALHWSAGRAFDSVHVDGFEPLP